MSFTAKKTLAARKKRDSAKGRLLEFTTNLAPVTAGPKNSNGPKGGSSKTKTSVPNNSRRGETKAPKANKKATKAKQAGSYFAPKGNAQISATPGVSNISNNRGAGRKSSRLNYSFLRKLGK